MVDLITQAEFARLVGVSKQAISKAIKTGRLPHDGGKLRRVEALAAWSGNPISDDRGDVLLREKTAKAELAELTVAQRRGELVERSEVLGAVEAVGADLGVEIERIAGWADELVGLPPDPVTVRDWLKTKVRALRADMAAKLAEAGRAGMAAAVAAAVALGIAPPVKAGVAEWAERHLVLVDGGLAGQRLDLGLTPYWREVLDCLDAEHPATEVVVMKSAQVGFTQAALGFLGHRISTDPGAIMTVFPTVQLSKDFNRTKLSPTIAATAALRMRVASQVNRSGAGSTALFKQFQGGFLLMTGANSSSALRSLTIRDVFCDEIDDWPHDLDGQGDPMEMVKARQTVFRALGGSKRLMGSTPTIEGESRVEKAYLAGDQRRFLVPCPHCGHEHALEWRPGATVHFSKTWPHQTYMTCPSCGGVIEHSRKRQMVAAGRWVAQMPEPGRQPSFHISALYSPFVPWDDLAAGYLAAQDDPQAMKAFMNLMLGLPSPIAGQAPDIDRLLSRRGEWRRGTLPEGVLVLTAGVDVQGDRLEVEIVGWGVGGTSWSIDYRVLPGDTMTAQPWDTLTGLLRGAWYDEAGRERRIEAMAIDAGFRPQRTYGFVRGRVNAIAVKGSSNRHAPPLGTPGKVDVAPDGAKLGSCLVYPVGTWTLKAQLYGLLGMAVSDPLPKGWCHFPADADETYFRGLTSERLVERPGRNGAAIRDWVRDRSVRNEPLDCRVYAMAAAEYLGLSRQDDEAWRRIAAVRLSEPPARQMDLLRAPGLGVAEAPVAPAPRPVEPARPVVADAGGGWVKARPDWLKGRGA